MPAPIRYLNRYTGVVETEAVYGERWLRWAYENPAGRFALWAIIKRPFFSRWYGARMDKGSSASMIGQFIQDYRIDMQEAEFTQEAYGSFNAFFTRRLKPGLRKPQPEADAIAFPADGRHLVIPDLSRQDYIHAKGQRLDLPALLGDSALAEKFASGSAVISRLCPVDYHRYHFPVSGRATEATLINGALYSVSPIALARNLSIFWQNKRTRTLIESSESGTVAMLEIGATCVGTIRQIYTPGLIQKGEEKGFFEFGGSCIITLFQKDRITFSDDLLRAKADNMELYAKCGDTLGHAL